jgi:hypothetical protein
MHPLKVDSILPFLFYVLFSLPLFISPIECKMKWDKGRNAGTTNQSIIPDAKSTVTWKGGPVISNVKVVLILWGGSSNVRYAKELTKFYDAVTTKSDWFDILKEYSTATQKIQNGCLWTQYSFDNAPTGTLTQEDIDGQIQLLIEHGHVPFPDANMYYAIHFLPGAVTYDFCISSCAWHSYFWMGQQQVYYGVIPDQDACPMGCGTGLAAILSTASHELAETITDPTGNSWMDDSSSEIADLCWDNGSTKGSDGKTYTVQKLWSNSVQQCVSGASSKRPSIRPANKKKPVKKK